MNFVSLSSGELLSAEYIKGIVWYKYKYYDQKNYIEYKTQAQETMK